MEDSDADLGLVISGCGEDLGLLGWNGRVSVDQTGENTSHCLNTEGKGSNIKKEDIFNISSKDGSLNCGSNSYSLIRVDTSVWLFTKELHDEFLDLWDSSGTTNKENFVDLVLGET